MKKTTIYLVRHGQSIGNLKHLYLGHTDLDLSELGHEQAKMTADHLSAVNFSAIYSSDLKRAFSTALPHAQMRGMDVIPSKMLRELYLGDWEGRDVHELMTNEKELFCDGWQKNFGTFTIPNGESVWEGGKRFTAEVDKIARKHFGETVLITAHAAVIRVFWGIISGIKPEDLADALNFPGNASYSIAEFDGERIIPIEYSNDQHITEKTGLS
jgi:broad specificity phosphatase PhoE